MNLPFPPLELRRANVNGRMQVVATSRADRLIGRSDYVRAKPKPGGTLAVSCRPDSLIVGIAQCWGLGLSGYALAVLPHQPGRPPFPPRDAANALWPHPPITLTSLTICRTTNRSLSRRAYGHKKT